MSRGGSSSAPTGGGVDTQGGAVGMGVGVGWTVKWKLNRKKEKNGFQRGVATPLTPSRSAIGVDAPSVWH